MPTTLYTSKEHINKALKHTKKSIKLLTAGLYMTTYEEAIVKELKKTEEHLTILKNTML